MKEKMIPTKRWKPDDKKKGRVIDDEEEKQI